MIIYETGSGHRENSPKKDAFSSSENLACTEHDAGGGSGAPPDRSVNFFRACH
eukprot:COSAG06_NODE_36783_length_443_cov_0.555233_1_plen_52_part_10